MISFLKAHKRATTTLLVVLGAFWLTPFERRVEFLLFFGIFVLSVVLPHRALSSSTNLMTDSSDQLLAPACSATIEPFRS